VIATNYFLYFNYSDNNYSDISFKTGEDNGIFAIDLEIVLNFFSFVFFL